MKDYGQDANKAIRAEIKRHRIKFYALADVIGIHTSSLSRWLAVPMTEEQTQRVKAGIKELVTQKERK